MHKVPEKTTRSSERPSIELTHEDTADDAELLADEDLRDCWEAAADAAAEEDLPEQGAPMAHSGTASSSGAGGSTPSRGPSTITPTASSSGQPQQEPAQEPADANDVVQDMIQAALHCVWHCPDTGNICSRDDDTVLGRLTQFNIGLPRHTAAVACKRHQGKCLRARLVSVKKLPRDWEQRIVAWVGRGRYMSVETHRDEWERIIKGGGS